MVAPATQWREQQRRDSGTTNGDTMAAPVTATQQQHQRLT